MNPRFAGILLQSGNSVGNLAGFLGPVVATALI